MKSLMTQVRYSHLWLGNSLAEPEPHGGPHNFGGAITL
jgi:hypothetical protein